MVKVIGSLIPLMLASTLVPSWITAVILLLQSRQGTRKAIALVTGMTTTRVLQVIVFGILFQNIRLTKIRNGAPLTVAFIEVLVGIFFLISALSAIFKVADSDDLTPTLRQRLNQLGPPFLYLVGLVWMLVSGRLFMFTLSATSIIASAFTGWVFRIIFYAIYIVGAGLLIYLPIVVVLCVPQRSATILKYSADWLVAHARLIIFALSTIFGCYFLWIGLAALL